MEAAGEYPSVVARQGLTVALIGPDGAGKTTIARALPGQLERRAKYIYMGVNWDASNHLLPTTRLVQAVRARRNRADDLHERRETTDVPSAGLASQLGRRAWRGLALANRVSEELYRQLVAWAYVRRGFVVVFDRHFFSDYHAADIAAREPIPVAKRIHGFFLAHVYPKPDLVVFLDAPAEVLHARKGEGTPESLEVRRQDYLAVAAVTPHFVSVDATKPLEQVTRDVVAAIESFAAPRRADGRPPNPVR